MCSVSGAGLALSANLCLHSTMDASQIRDGPFNFWGRVDFLNICFTTLTWKHVRTCVRAYVRTAIDAPASPVSNFVVY